ncbi:hypothetical protein [Granulicella sp. WH15]|uniref:hypothetical protein n=1 Tax=Granulicella sp. WH15 TaxID=2602070 RepID=UPI001C707253|nr:hypothetical protein [Granulicella sp. WH15]
MADSSVLPPAAGRLAFSTDSYVVHGMAIMSVRVGLEFQPLIRSDTAALNGLVAILLPFSPHLHVLARGGLAGSLHETEAQSQVGILFDERSLPVLPEVQAACDHARHGPDLCTQ